MLLQPFKLVPEYRHYLWGGHRLGPGPEPTAEVWIVYEMDSVADGPLKGLTLAHVSETYRAAFLGDPVVQRTGTRFPLLIKLLDCADWLSVQVHPNNEQAHRLEGSSKFGKTEAWHIIEADQGAEIICGLHAGIDPPRIYQAIQTGSILELVQRLTVHPGDTIFIPPGMIHALGPGLLLYEVQQTSDITYRVYDWDRPPSTGRKLHIPQSLDVIDPKATGSVRPLIETPASSVQTLISCDYFTLDMISGDNGVVTAETGLLSFHSITLLDGLVQVMGEGWHMPIKRFETLLIPAECSRYFLQAAGSFRALRASVG